MTHEAIWTNGIRTISGTWEYYWPSDRFIIRLRQRDRVTGENKKLVVAGDRPQWGRWKLIE